jgi:peptidoglycan/xylan/chitin deacetylase (PgdA/CDA1 family)
MKKRHRVAAAAGVDRQLDRRRFLLGGAAAALVAACSSKASKGGSGPAATTASSPPLTTLSPTPSTTAVAGGPAKFVRSGPASSRAVALTFHGSGDLTLAHALLDAAKRSNAPITVFAVGQWLDQNPSITQAIQAGGHELANHTYTHPALASVSRTTLASEITRCRDVLARESGSGGRWFRPSGVDVPTQAMLDEAGTAGYPVVVGYDIDPLDYQDPGSAAVLARIKERLHPGAIVSLHTGHSGTVDAFQPIVEAVRAAGLQPVLLHNLLP